MKNDITEVSNNLVKAAEEATKQVLREVGEKAVSIIKQYIQDCWYDTYDPKSYERTYKFKDSVTYSIENNTIIVSWDMRKLKGITRKSGWNAHKGFDKDNFTYGLINWIENGEFMGGTLSNPRRLDGGIESIPYTSKIINEYINDFAIKKIKLKFKEIYRNL